MTDIPFHELDPGIRFNQVTNSAWELAGRLGFDLDAVITLDPSQPRDPRLLVPVDLQAFVSTGAGGTRADVRTRAGDGGDERMPPPFSPTDPLPAGVHLHWALPDGLTHADPEVRGDDDEGDLGFRPAPDRWLVARIATTLDTVRRRPVTAWVVDSTTARVSPLSEWRETGFDDTVPGAIAPAELNPASGGDMAWAAVYDSAVGRFGFHDPLDGVTGVSATFSYVVMGWYSQPELDPLHDAFTLSRFEATLDELGWDVDLGGMDDANVLSAERIVHTRTLVAQAGGDPADVRTIAHIEHAEELFFDRQWEIVDRFRPTHPRLSIFHGTVYGVVTSRAATSSVPIASKIDLVLGPTMSDASAGLLSDDRDQELLLGAFAHRILDDAVTADDWSEIDAARHQRSFMALPDPAPPIEEIVIRDEAAAVSTRVGKPQEAPVSSTATSIPFGVENPILLEFVSAKHMVSDVLSARPLEMLGGVQLPHAVLDDLGGIGRLERIPRRVVETISRPGPRYWQPADPVIVFAGAERSLRHGYDGRFEDDDTLQCRLTGQPVSGIAGVCTGADLVAPLGHGGIPPECDDLLEEAAIADPSAIDANTGAATADGRTGSALDADAVELRFAAESTFNRTVRGQIGDLADLASASLQEGLLASPVAAAPWIQPWIPLYVEWEATVVTRDTLEGWELDEIDLVPTAPPTGEEKTFAGRSHLAGAPTKLLADILRAHADKEARLDAHGKGILTTGQERDLAELVTALDTADLSVASLAGLRDLLLGIDPLALHDDVPAPSDDAILLRGGHLTVDKLRIVDAFGQFVDLTERLTALHLADAYDTDDGLLPDRTAVIAPRFTAPARTRLRFLDATDDTVEARVDESTPVLTRNPIAGYLLPDHADDAVECFGPDGSPLGQLFHSGLGQTVTWEGPPGFDAPTATGPLPTGATRHLASICDAIIRRDVAQTDAGTGVISPLTGLLRAIDTTTWTTDPFGSTGTEHTSVLLGRPVAVVRAAISFDLLDVPADALADRAIEVRLGSLSRFDDGLLGYFIDDDYSVLRPVHAAVAQSALALGAHTGFLDSVTDAKAYGDTLTAEPIATAYVASSSTLLLRPGQTRMLTLLLRPGHGVHATTGVVPRKKLELARSWVAEPLGRIVPSFRVGPVLVDPKSIRMPPISALGPAQEWSRRDTPSSWRNDAIAAASDTARLSDTPAVAQEGWVRARQEGDT